MFSRFEFKINRHKSFVYKLIIKGVYMNEFIEESKKIIQRSSYNNKLVIFVGAGVSKDSGLPLWRELIDDIKRKIKVSHTNDDSLKIAQYYYNSRGKKEYYDFLNEKLGIDAEPNKIHDVLLELNPSHIITTNYDDLLEKAASRKGMFFDVVAKDNDLPYTPNNKMIIKMHGDFKNRNIVFKEDDYLSYSNNFKLIENYIKSLFSTKTVIFVGYSLSDINVKLAFQWIKDILGNDLQRPYFIDVNKEDEPIDINEFEYYKNKGINILYYSEIFKLLNGVEESNDKGIRTYNAIKYFLSKDENVLNEEYIYEYIEGFKDINKLNKKVLMNLLNSLDLLNGTDFEIEWDTLYVRSYKFFKIYSDIIDRLKKLEKNEYDNKKEKLEAFFDKIGIKNIVTEIYDGKKIEDKQIYEINYINKEPAIQKYLETYDFRKIQEYIDNINLNEDKINSKNINRFFEKAYLLYYLKNYYGAYLEYKKISQFCFKNENYMQYVISEFNRYYIGRYINGNWMIEENIRKRVKEEINKINLEKILYNIPLDIQQLEFLNNIISWDFVQTDIKDMVIIKKEIEKDEQTIHIGKVDKRRIGIYKLQEKAKNLWEFLKHNLLVIDNYKEVNLIFSNYIDSLLRSYSIPKLTKTKEETFLGIEGESVKIEEINIFDIRMMLEYISLKDLRAFFERYNIEELKVKEEDVQILIQIFENYIKQNKENNFKIIFFILSKINLTKKNFIKVNNMIIDLLKASDVVLHDMNEMKNLNSYIYYQEKNFKNYDRETLVEILKIILKDICNYETNNNSHRVNVIHNVCAFINEYDMDIQLDLDELLTELIGRTKKDKEVFIILIYLYKVVNSKDKKKIKKIIDKYLNQEKFDYNLANVYYDSIFTEMIKPSVEHENKLISFIDTLIESRNKSVRTYPDLSKTLLKEAMNLILSDKVTNKEMFKKYIDQEKDFNFLYNLDNYNGEEINIEWLSDFSEELLIRISKNIQIKEQIKKQLKNIYLSGETVDKEILKIFIKYFLD